jgi:hypothetical protein
MYFDQTDQLRWSALTTVLTICTHVIVALGPTGYHTAELAAPVVAGLWEAEHTAQLCHRRARLGFVQEANDLCFCKSSLYIQSPVCRSGLEAKRLLKYGGT